MSAGSFHNQIGKRNDSCQECIWWRGFLCNHQYIWTDSGNELRRLNVNKACHLGLFFRARWCLHLYCLGVQKHVQLEMNGVFLVMVKVFFESSFTRLIHRKYKPPPPPPQTYNKLCAIFASFFVTESAWHPRDSGVPPRTCCIYTHEVPWGNLWLWCPAHLRGKIFIYLTRWW